MNAHSIGVNYRISLQIFAVGSIDNRIDLTFITKENDGNNSKSLNCLGHDKQVLRSLNSLRAQKKCLEVTFKNNVIFPLKKRCNIVTKPSNYKKISRTINSEYSIVIHVNLDQVQVL